MTSPEVRELIRLAVTMPPREYSAAHIVGGEAFAFDWNATRHRAFREEIAAKLRVPVGQVVVIGSSKFGFSLNPDTLLREFSPAHSDIDIVIVAAEVFDNAVLELAAEKNAIRLANDDERHRLRKTREHVADGYIRPDQLPLMSGLARDWFPRLAGPYGTPLAQRLPVKAWLFKSMEHAQLLYAEHLNRMQPKLRRMLESRGTV